MIEARKVNDEKGWDLVKMKRKAIKMTEKRRYQKPKNSDRYSIFQSFFSRIQHETDIRKGKQDKFIKNIKIFCYMTYIQYILAETSYDLSLNVTRVAFQFQNR